LQKKTLLRRNDLEYLHYVTLWYSQIGKQIQGQLWKDGGPVIGVQVENEYGEAGPGAGAEHLAGAGGVPKRSVLVSEAGMSAAPLGWAGRVRPQVRRVGASILLDPTLHCLFLFPLRL
jgi:hypothetical protein